ncbi:uncharacterized protein LOC134529787 isoform X1 [Bacillus rossius redtenbacheri]|uniref:uncharacterized protein LOC134529787 isoform X1 n=1 Tax=Bacillus rossius redtenbacheri TaxID=93214 RepID=UPI002FDEC60C
MCEHRAGVCHLLATHVPVNVVVHSLHRWIFHRWFPESARCNCVAPTLFRGALFFFFLIFLHLDFLVFWCYFSLFCSCTHTHCFVVLSFSLIFLLLHLYGFLVLFYLNFFAPTLFRGAICFLHAPTIFVVLIWLEWKWWCFAPTLICGARIFWLVGWDGSGGVLHLRCLRCYVFLVGWLGWKWWCFASSLFAMLRFLVGWLGWKWWFYASSLFELLHFFGWFVGMEVVVFGILVVCDATCFGWLVGLEVVVLCILVVCDATFFWLVGWLGWKWWCFASSLFCGASIFLVGWLGWKWWCFASSLFCGASIFLVGWLGWKWWFSAPTMFLWCCALLVDWFG